MKHRPVLVLLMIAGLLLAGACSKNATEPDPSASATQVPAPDTAPRSAKILPLPGQGGGSPSANPSAALLAWDVPRGWVEETPASNMRRAQYRVPGDAGDAECIVFYFGPGQGGDPRSNAVRWARQFKQADGSDSTELMQTQELDGVAVAVELVEVTGIYDGGMSMTDAPAESKNNYMLLGAIAEGPDAPWFFKFTGPESTVRAQRDAFVGMMKSLRGEP